MIGKSRWAKWLPLAGFAYNTTATSTHGYSPYRSLYGFDPRTIHISDDHEFKPPAAEEWLDRMTAVHNQIHATLKQINDKRSALFKGRDKSWKLKAGDKVLVDRRSLTVKSGNEVAGSTWK